ncbi:MAG: formylglycine-generating enzyme family protein [Planctomycetota bacterium]|nr:formylglycine-generating enzyme family protein [Planctomycetota bacterium]
MLLLAGSLGALAVIALLVPHWHGIALWYRLRPSFVLHAWKNERGLMEFRHWKTGILMVLIPGGDFRMGSAESEAGSQENERPRHPVTLDPYLISKHEVSQRQWSQVMGTNPSRFRGESRPVETVSWKACEQFCGKTGLELPSEAQWEFACRAGSPAAFSFGDTITSDQVVHNPRSAAYTATAPVGSRRPNAFGLHDMHGNVQEWCQDLFRRGFYATPEATERNPVCTSNGSGRVIRGGNWNSDPGRCRSAVRNAGDEAHDFLIVGFRPAFYPLP